MKTGVRGALARVHGLRVAGMAAAVLLVGCATGTTVNTWVPAYCHGAAAPFSTYAIELEQVPGFKAPIMRDGLAAALSRRGLVAAPAGADADVTMLLRITLIQRGGALANTTSDDDFDGRIASDNLSRFVAHADLELTDNRDGRLIWKGGMDRSHAISGGETFHDDRARALIAAALDNALEGLDTPCP